MRLYHRTSSAGAAAILASGFRDGTGSHSTEPARDGVWLAARPHDDAGGEALLVVELNLPAATLAAYECADARAPHRAFLFPAELLNAHGVAWLAGDLDLALAAGESAGPG
jgi:hypothetical protein